jgi:hypothetical protein
MTTVPAASFCVVGTHSATSWYLAEMLPVTVTSPTTWNFVAGAFVPTPTLPSLVTTTASGVPWVPTKSGRSAVLRR